jgi:PadR family transcriptional regulator, regulatory protein PadR
MQYYMKTGPNREEKKRRLGEFEEIVLLAILRLGDDAYGVPIRRLIEAETNRHISFGALYTTFDRLERKGYISSRQGGATKERGGRAKRYLTVEGAGLDAVRASQYVRAKMLAGLRPVLA